MPNNILYRIKKRDGTTLVETLATVVLIGIMGVALTAGIGTVRNTYGRIVRRSNEQIILSTTITEMRNLIHNAVDAEVISGQQPYFKSLDGYWFQFIPDTSGTTGDGIKIHYVEKNLTNNTFSAITTGSGDLADVKLMTKDLNSNQKLYSTFSTIRLDKTKGIAEIVGLTVKCVGESGEGFELKYPDDDDDPDSYFVSCFGLQNGGAS